MSSSSALPAKTQDQLRQCGKLLAMLMGHKDAGEAPCRRQQRVASLPAAARSLAVNADPFLNPVEWKQWGLLDYPKVIKTPMDLNTVKVRAVALAPFRLRLRVRGLGLTGARLCRRSSKATRTPAPRSLSTT